jgi:hypothetical protein
MPAPLTPQPASSSYVLQEAFDVPEQRFAQVGYLTSTATVNLGVNSTSNYAGTIPFIAKTVYSVGNVVTTTYNSALPSQYTISRVYSSAPVLVRNVTAYQQVVPSNTTVWDSSGVAHSLLLTPGQNDVVSYTVVVVADSIF